MADSTPKSYSADDTLYLYTSLTAGSSHIITATSRMETILKANRISFRAVDVATDEKARMLWGRRSKGRKLPGLVRYGSIVGDLEEVEEWNEFGELKQVIGSVPAVSATPVGSATNTPSKPVSKAPASSENTPPAQPIPITPTASNKEREEPVSGRPTPSPQSHVKIADTAQVTKPMAASTPPPSSAPGESPVTLAMRQAGAEAAKKAGDKKIAKNEEIKARLAAQSAEQKAPDVLPEARPTGTAITEAAEERIADNNQKEAKKAPSADDTAIKTTAQSVGKGSIEKEIAANVAENVEKIPAAAEETTSKDLLDKEEPAIKSSTSLVPDDSGETTPQHRGSIVAEASEAKVTEIEQETAIPEAKEEEETHVKAGESSELSSEAKAGDDAEKKKAEKDSTTSSENTALKDVTATSISEKVAPDGGHTQEQEAKNEEAAGASVGD
ncbi:MAG: hypothetical protein Q9227_003688 [Pyrenula ochraceoflavens]